MEREILVKNRQLNTTPFAKLVSSSDDMFVLTNKHGQIFYVSPSFELYTQYSLEEINSIDKAINLIHPDYLEETLRVKQLIYANPNLAFTRELKFRIKDGSYLWVEGKVTNYLDEPGLEAIVSVYRNISTRKAIEESASRRETMFKSLIESNKDMMALSSENGRLFYISPSVTKILGYKIENLLKIGLLDLIHPDDAELLLTKTLEILKNPGGSFESKQRLKHKNGNWIWCEGTATNLLFEPSVEALVLNFRDISERKKSEQQRDFDRSNLKALINNTDDLIWSVNTNFKLISSNLSFDSIVEAMSGNIISKGKDVLAIGFSNEQLKRWKAFYERAFKGEKFTIIEHTHVPIERCSEISFSPIYKDEKIVGTACYSRDILKKVKSEERLIKQYNTLKEIAFMLSHQARAPIASVLGLISLINFENIADPLNIEVLENVKKTTHLFDNAIHEIVKSTAELNKLESN